MGPLTWSRPLSGGDWIDVHPACAATLSARAASWWLYLWWCVLVTRNRIASKLTLASVHTPTRRNTRCRRSRRSAACRASRASSLRSRRACVVGSGAAARWVGGRPPDGRRRLFFFAKEVSVLLRLPGSRILELDRFGADPRGQSTERDHREDRDHGHDDRIREQPGDLVGLRKLRECLRERGVPGERHDDAESRRDQRDHRGQELAGEPARSLDDLDDGGLVFRGRDGGRFVHVALLS